MKHLLAVVLILLLCNSTLAVESDPDNIHKNDYKGLQFNLMNSVDNKIPFGLQDDNYLEMEFWGRSGFIDLYGFIDVFDIFDSSSSDFHEGDNFFLKLEPRFSLDVISGHNLAVGPFKEWYLATRFYVGDRALFEQFLGIGTDAAVPWFGKVGVDIYARYVRENFGAANEGTWDGYLFSFNWYTPFFQFNNKSSLVYQGYFDHVFAAYEIADDKDRSDASVGWYNGLYWHSDRYAIGYGLKIYQDMALFKDGGIGGNTSGAGHYFVLTYKF